MVRGWIPIVPLALGALASGASWIALFYVARTGTFGASFPAFAWLHLVALGWITLIALSVLVHVIPEFSDVAWRNAIVARWAIWAYAIGVFVLLSGFVCENLVALQIGAALAAVAILIYVVQAIATLSQAFAGEPLERAIARAFVLTLSFLFLTAMLGSLFAFALAGHFPPSALVQLPRVHALLGIGGWLTLLVMGVSARTLRPMTGVRTRFRVLHIAASSAVALGTLGSAVALMDASMVWTEIGLAVVVLGCLFYAIDVLDIVTRATVPHRAPQALMLSAACFAILAATLALAASMGLKMGSAAIYAALVGWIGSAVIAHFHHIGVRVMLTTTRGDDDETRPWEVLIAPLTWTCAGLYTGAALIGVVAIIVGLSFLLEIAAIAGLLSFVTMVSNLIAARRAAQRLPISLV